MLAAPTLAAVAPRVAERIAPGRHLAASDGEAAAMAATGHVIVLGFGVGGRLVASALREFGIPYRIIDLNGVNVREARAAGEPIFYGDATVPDTLVAAGVERARSVVVVLSDPDASLKIVSNVRRLAPEVAVLVRARYRTEAVRLHEAGAIAVAEELEASLEVMAQLLSILDVPGNIVQVLVEDARRREAMLAVRQTAPPRVPLQQVPADLLSAPVATHQLRDGDWAAGRSMGEVNLRALTGASVLAIRRDGRSWTSPPPDLRLAAGDVLYLLGDASDVLLAREHLSRGDVGASGLEP
jgi:CPA2 family monovalent cation:H+ antiporter-2